MKTLRIGNGIDPSKRCVISLGIGKEVYTSSLMRLVESLRRVKFDGDFLFWDEKFPEGCPPHFDAPFAFKAYCFYEANRLGYTQILWIDSTCVAMRSLSPIFESMNQILSNLFFHVSILNLNFHLLQIFLNLHLESIIFLIYFDLSLTYIY